MKKKSNINNIDYFVTLPEYERVYFECFGLTINFYEFISLGEFKDEELLKFLKSSGFDLKIKKYLPNSWGSARIEGGDYYLYNEDEKILANFTSIKPDLDLLFSNSKAYVFFEKLKEEIQKTFPIIKKEESPRFQMLIQNHGGFNYTNIETPKIDLNIEENYNDDFKDFNETVVDFFLDNERSGLVIASGIMGSGKSHWLRYLICKLSTVDFVFIPPNIIPQMAEPAFLNFFLSHAYNKVFIVEDAELALKSRDNNQNSYISTILNWTDGLIGASLKTKFICTLNCSMNNVDSALKRKGRMVAEYNFKALEIAKSNALLAKLNKNHITNEPMTLAEIYNFESKNSFSTPEEKRSIGFAK